MTMLNPRPSRSLRSTRRLWLGGSFVVLAAAFAAACGGASNGGGETGSPSPRPTESSDDIKPVPGINWPDWPNTDFNRTTIDLNEVIRGCPSRDCIPPLDAAGATTMKADRNGDAVFAPVAEVDYPGNYPVVLLRLGDTVRGYPLHILTWHEVVNDVVDEVPVAVTFCPLCNTALAFDRRVDGRVLDFGVSGNLRHSDLIMWDRQTESWWQQATGEGIVGWYAGTDLTPIAVSIVSFADFKSQFPQAGVLTEKTGLSRDYGVNPYTYYDEFGSQPFLFLGKIDPRLDGLERVVGLGRETESPLAVPFEALAEHPVANVEVDGRPIVVLWSPGTASALDAADIARAKDVGAAAAFEATLDEQVLSFTAEAPGRYRDDQTGSLWDVFGRAVEGPLSGSSLQPVVHTTEFWFAWAAFQPETTIWEGP